MYSFHKYGHYVLFKYFISLIFISRCQLSVTFCPEERFYFRTVSVQQEANVMQYCPTSFHIQYLSDFRAFFGIRKILFFFLLFCIVFAELVDLGS